MTAAGWLVYRPCRYLSFSDCLLFRLQVQRVNDSYNTYNIEHVWWQYVSIIIIMYITSAIKMHVYFACLSNIFAAVCTENIHISLSFLRGSCLLWITYISLILICITLSLESTSWFTSPGLCYLRYFHPTSHVIVQSFIITAFTTYQSFALPLRSTHLPLSLSFPQTFPVIHCSCPVSVTDFYRLGHSFSDFLCWAVCGLVFLVSLIYSSWCGVHHIRWSLWQWHIW